MKLTQQIFVTPVLFAPWFAFGGMNFLTKAIREWKKTEPLLKRDNFRILIAQSYLL